MSEEFRKPIVFCSPENTYTAKGILKTNFENLLQIKGLMRLFRNREKYNLKIVTKFFYTTCIKEVGLQ